MEHHWKINPKVGSSENSEGVIFGRKGKHISHVGSKWWELVGSLLRLVGGPQICGGGAQYHEKRCHLREPKSTDNIHCLLQSQYFFDVSSEVSVATHAVHNMLSLVYLQTTSYRISFLSVCVLNQAIQIVLKTGVYMNSGPGPHITCQKKSN